MNTEIVQDSIETIKNDGIQTFFGKGFLHFWYPIGWNRRVVGRMSVSTLSQLFEIRSRIFPRISDSNPLRLVWVDPNDIIYYQGRGPWMFGRVVAGDWDAPEVQFEDTMIYQSFKKRFVDEVGWPETELYQKYSQRLENGTPHYRCTSPSELEAYFDSVDTLYEHIRTEGYKSQRDLLQENPETAREVNNDAPHPALHEVSVNIYRDGTLAKKGAGFHRLAIAKLLSLDEIPVVVRVRHKEWQAIRDQIRNAESRYKLCERSMNALEHPDMKDIVPKDWIV